MENPVSERRTRSDTNRSKNRDCINGSELGGLFVDGLSLLKTPVLRLARIQPDGSSDRLRVLTTCAAAVYDLALAGFDVVELGHTTLMPAVIRDIDEWSILLLAAVGDDSISEDLMSDRLCWRKVERVAKAQWPENITALLKDWGIASGLVHHERRLSVTRYWPGGHKRSTIVVGGKSRLPTDPHMVDKIVPLLWEPPLDSSKLGWDPKPVPINRRCQHRRGMARCRRYVAR